MKNILATIVICIVITNYAFSQISEQPWKENSDGIDIQLTKTSVEYDRFTNQTDNNVGNLDWQNEEKTPQQAAKLVASGSRNIGNREGEDCTMEISNLNVVPGVSYSFDVYITRNDPPWSADTALGTLFGFNSACVFNHNYVFANPVANNLGSPISDAIVTITNGKINVDLVSSGNPVPTTPELLFTLTLDIVDPSTTASLTWSSLDTVIYDSSNLNERTAELLASPQISINNDSLYFSVIKNEGYQQNQTLTITNNGNSLLEVELHSNTTVTDIDGNVYQTVQIGDQLWMAENLKVTRYRNGDPISLVTSNSTWSNISSGAYCVYDNNPDNTEIYGNLYNWYAVNDLRGLAPEGWHLPTDTEIMEIEMYLGMSQQQANNTGWRGTNEGSKLAGKADLWENGALEDDIEFGFSNFDFLPGGFRLNNGTFFPMELYGGWWSSTVESTNDAWRRLLSYNDTEVNRDSKDKKHGFSVRCVKSITGLNLQQSEKFDSSSGISQREDNFISSWISFSPAILSLESGQSATISITVDAEHLDFGDYSENITIISNDPENSVIDMPVTLVVTGTIADFTADVTEGFGPLTVNFSDQSSSANSIMMWQWDFENDGTIDSYEQNPSWTYTTEGNYSVKLIVESETGADSLIKENYISVTYALPPDPLFIEIQGSNVMLSWDSVPWASYYKVYVSTDPNAEDWGDPISIQTELNISIQMTGDKLFFKVVAGVED